MLSSLHAYNFLSVNNIPTSGRADMHTDVFDAYKILLYPLKEKENLEVYIVLELGWKEIIRQERYVKRVSGRFGWTLLFTPIFP